MASRLLSVTLALILTAQPGSPARAGTAPDACAAPLAWSNESGVETVLSQSAELPWLFAAQYSVVAFDPQLSVVGSTSLGVPIVDMLGPAWLASEAHVMLLADAAGDIRRLTLGPGSGSAQVSMDPTWTQSTLGPCLGTVAGLALHRLEEASAAFAAAWDRDLVYVGTQLGTGCAGYRADNVIVALDADTGAYAWTFNDPTTVDMDAVHGTVLDAPADRLYVATDQRLSVTQPSLWALDTVTGTHLWGVDAGRIHTRPLLGEGRVYVANRGGELVAIDTQLGEVAWTLPSGTGLPFLVDPVLVLESGAPPVIYTLDLGGRVRRAEDLGASGSWTWTQDLPLVHGPALPTAALAVKPGMQQLFASDDDGRIHVLDAQTGALIECRSAGAGPGSIGTLFVPTEDFAPDALLATSSSPQQISLYSSIPIGAPRVTTPIPDQPALRVDAGWRLSIDDLHEHFEDGDGDPLHFTIAGVEPPGNLEVALSGPGDQALSLRALRHGGALVTVRTSDLAQGAGEGLAEDSFFVPTVGVLSDAGMAPDSQLAGAVTSWSVAFTTPSDMPAYTFVEIDFPGSFDIAQATMPLANAPGATLQMAGRDLQRQTVILVVREGTVAAGARIALRLSNVRNPEAAGPGGGYELSTRSPSEPMDVTTLPGHDFTDSLPDSLFASGFEG